MDYNNQNIGSFCVACRNLECCGVSNLDTGSSYHSLSSMIAFLVVWSNYLSGVYKNLRNFVEASDGLRYTKNQIVWDCCPISQFFWENWTFFATFLEKKHVLYYKQVNWPEFSDKTSNFHGNLNTSEFPKFTNFLAYWCYGILTQPRDFPTIWCFGYSPLFFFFYRIFSNIIIIIIIYI